MISLCDQWEYTDHFSDEFMTGGGDAVSVRLPHTVRELPLHYADAEDYRRLCGYRRRLSIPKELEGRRVFLQLDGAAHQAEVYVNGRPVGSHRCGYTAFRVELTDCLRFGGDDLLAVKLDTSEDGAIPPFGFVVDYLCYGGLYREAWLDIRPQSYIGDVFVTTPSEHTAKVQLSLCGELDTVRLSVLDGETPLAQSTGGAAQELFVPTAELWDIASPKLYTLRAELLDPSGAVIDTQKTVFGFRQTELRADGFYLNGRRVFLRGLNRHQSYPVIGYAAPESLQREDARILQEELCCNAVRTSHYPQSQYFIDECDRRGLLVFTELPGWQHIGDAAWKEQALENLREMILQYRNHPSIVLWGVRINESADDDEFYERANAIAHELDPSRATSGVRFIEKSHLLEDVYAYNDFTHSGGSEIIKQKTAVTPDKNKALLISEHNGHMFPTKPFDPWEKRQEQALRHARVLNAAYASNGHAGCFGWCMFDYQTHKDFGSGDRICYHGVMDAYRNPKLAAALYAAQGENTPVLELGCPMDIGDYPAGDTGSIYAFTNADTVELYKNDAFVKAFTPTEFSSLPHGAALIDDTIGELLTTQEGFTGAKAELLRACLVSAGKYGLAAMPLPDKLKMLWCMARYGLTLDDGLTLYAKYVGNWGGEATRWRFDAIKNGRVFASQTKCPSTRLHLELRVSARTLVERQSYDMAAVRIRILDEYDNLCPYAQLPVRLRVTGDIELVGESVVCAEGGSCGAYIKSLGRAGTGTLTVRTAQTEAVTVEFEVKT